MAACLADGGAYTARALAAMVHKVGAALRQTVTIRQKYAERAQATKSPQEQQALTTQAQTEMVQAISDQGLSKLPINTAGPWRNMWSVAVEARWRKTFLPWATNHPEIWLAVVISTNGVVGIDSGGMEITGVW